MTSFPAAPRKRRLRFTLRLAMAAVVIAAIPLARLAVEARAQKDAVRAIVRSGGTVAYDWQLGPNGRYNATASVRPGPTWLRKLMGPDCFETVESVDLSRDEMGDDLMEHVGRLRGLRRLYLGGMGVTDAGMAHVAGLSHLTHFNTQGPSRITGASLAQFRGKRELRHLLFFVEGFRDEHLAALASLDGLETLMFSGDGVTDAGMVHLRGLANLKRLRIDHTRVTSAGLENFRGFHKLEHINLPKTVGRITPVCGLTRLRIIIAWNACIDDAGLEGIEDLKALTELMLGMTSVTDAGLERLKGLDQMQVLALARTAVSDAGLAHLSGMTKLQGLNLDGTKVTDAGLVHLRGLTSLQWLGMRRTRVTGRGLAQLSGLPSLAKLFLGSAPIDDSGMIELSKLGGLSSIDLSHTLITDSGLMSLAAQPGPFSLDLTGTQVTATGVARFRKATKVSRVDAIGN